MVIHFRARREASRLTPAARLEGFSTTPILVTLYAGLRRLSHFQRRRPSSSSSSVRNQFAPDYGVIQGLYIRVGSSGSSSSRMTDSVGRRGRERVPLPLKRSRGDIKHCSSWVGGSKSLPWSCICKVLSKKLEFVYLFGCVFGFSVATRVFRAWRWLLR